jgi:hypothetical protein
LAQPIEAETMKKLCIAGSGPNTRDKAPWDDPEFDIWVLNEAGNHKWCKRWDAVLQMHEPEIYKGHNTKDPKHWEWLQQSHGKPIYMQEVDPDVPDSVEYPLDAAIALSGERYLAATIAQACALAILKGYEYVRFDGIELSATEYLQQAECIRYWVGFLKGRLGAENVNADSCKHLFEAPLYGYEGNFVFGSDYFAERARFLDNQWQASSKNLHNLKKAIERAVANREHDKVERLTIEFRDAALATGELAGALSEAKRYQTFGDRFADRGGFEYAAAKAQRDGEAKRPMIWHLGGVVESMWNAWRQTDNQRAKDQMFELIGRMSGCAEEVGALLGMYRENIAYILKYDAMVQANGGLKELVTA